MKYLILLYEDENRFDSLSSEEKMEVINEHAAYTEAMEKAGVHLGGEPLDHSRSGKRVRADRVEDGPFVDGKEQLGGFYMIEAPNLDEALDWAAKSPTAQTGHVEVRPVWNIGG